MLDGPPNIRECTAEKDARKMGVSENGALEAGKRESVLPLYVRLEVFGGRASEKYVWLPW